QRNHAAGLLDLLARARRNRVRDDGQVRRQFAFAEDLHVLAGRTDQSGFLQQLGGHLGPGVETRQCRDVHGLSVRTERADRHFIFRRRAALLARAHVDGHLPALEAGTHLVRAGPRFLTLDTAAGIAAFARAETAADALALLAGLRRLQCREVELHYSDSSTRTRWRTFRSIPATTGLSSFSTARPILPSPSARNVPRWRCVSPIWERTWVMRSFAI